MHSKELHNGGNGSHKRQFLALGVRSQSWKLNNLLKKIFSNWLVLQAAYYNLTEKSFAQIISVTSNAKFPILKSRQQTNGANWPWFLNANLILVTSSNWINCSFSRPSKVRMSFCQIAAKFFFFKFKICKTVARHKYDK